ncbi:hypothetical protein KAH94_03100, partial [bacterium]|nr:hypothetical protein [bacterium]
EEEEEEEFSPLSDFPSLEGIYIPEEKEEEVNYPTIEEKEFLFQTLTPVFPLSSEDIKKQEKKEKEEKTRDQRKEEKRKLKPYLDKAVTMFDEAKEDVLAEIVPEKDQPKKLTEAKESIEKLINATNEEQIQNLFDDIADSFESVSDKKLKNQKEALKQEAIDIAAELLLSFEFIQ